MSAAAEQETMITESWKGPCRCGVEVVAGNDETGRPVVLHMLPMCDVYERTDDIASFLTYVRTGVMPGN